MDIYGQRFFLKDSLTNFTKVDGVSHQVRRRLEEIKLVNISQVILFSSGALNRRSKAIGIGIII